MMMPTVRGINAGAKARTTPAAKVIIAWMVNRRRSVIAVEPVSCVRGASLAARFGT
jgi:hypothetical protein